MHPKAVRVFERQWLVNIILWGNYRRLRNAVMEILDRSDHARTLQVACVYGDFTERLLERQAPGSSLDVLDVLPIQLENLQRKLQGPGRLGLHLSDAAGMDFPDDTYDLVVLFFLLHEMPLKTRERTISEAMRVTRPGGRVVFVDYHAPRSINPMGWLMRPVLRWLEPFALDLWRNEIVQWVPEDVRFGSVQKRTYFGGLYQRVVLEKK